MVSQMTAILLFADAEQFYILGEQSTPFSDYPIGFYSDDGSGRPWFPNTRSSKRWQW
jgi:hypothetical protein